MNNLPFIYIFPGESAELGELLVFGVVDPSRHIANNEKT